MGHAAIAHLVIFVALVLGSVHADVPDLFVVEAFPLLRRFSSECGAPDFEAVVKAGLDTDLMFGKDWGQGTMRR